MSNEKRVEHPAPWTWERDDAYRHPLTASRLVDANRASILEANTDDDVEAASPVVRELIRLAPELEQALRNAQLTIEHLGAQVDAYGRQYKPRDTEAEKEIASLLNALDAARAAKP